MGFYLNKATAQKQTRAHTYLQMKMRTKPLGDWLLPLVVAVLLSNTQRVVADENDIFPDLLDLQDIPGCTLDPSLKFDEIDEVYFEVQALNCMDYNDTFVPFPDLVFNEYGEVTDMVVQGEFSQFTASPKYAKLKSVKLQSYMLTQLLLRNFKDFAELESITTDFSGVATLDLSGSSLGLEKLEAIRMYENKMDEITGTFENLPALSEIELSKNNLVSFDMQILPRSLTYLGLSGNHLKVLDAQYLPSSLRQLLAVGNNLTSFDLKAMEQLDLGDSELIFSVDGNPLDCDCQYLDDFVHLLSTKNVACPSFSTPLCLRCDKASPLRHYTFDNNIEQLLQLDEFTEKCKSGGAQGGDKEEESPPPYEDDNYFSNYDVTPENDGNGNGEATPTGDDFDQTKTGDELDSSDDDVKAADRKTDPVGGGGGGGHNAASSDFDTDAEGGISGASISRTAGASMWLVIAVVYLFGH